MATAAPSTNHRTKADKKPGRKPPEDSFWQRYSPHHEFPLSLASSLFLHVLVWGAISLVLTGALLTWLGLKDEPLPVDTIVVAGGGGNPNGVGDGPGSGAVPAGEEAIEKKTPAANVTKPLDTAKLDAPTPKTEPILNPAEPLTDARKVAEDVASADLSQLRGKADKKLRDILAGKGRGGAGSGGGKGSGTGTGEGDLSGPGKMNMSQRQKRQERWTMIFNTRDGRDYLNQLRDLGAILAINGPSGEYLVIRDLTPPVHPKPEDLAQLNRIFWIDDKPQSVLSLSLAMGLPEVPSRIVAFFPVELENKLRDLEKQAYGGKEDNIRETYFKVERRGNHYEPVVSSVDVNRR